jgi:hypothetical protein
VENRAQRREVFDQIEQLSHLAKSSAQLMNDLVGRFPTVDGLPDQIGKAKVEAAQGGAINAKHCTWNGDSPSGCQFWT